MGVINITLSRRRQLQRLLEDLNAVQADIVALRNTHSGHTHGGVATGTDSTGAGPISGPASATSLPFDGALPTSRLIKRLAEAVALLRNDISNLKNALDGHTHGGVTTGAGTTAAGPTLNAVPDPVSNVGASAVGLRTALSRLYRYYNNLAATLASYKTAIDGHTHGGVTTGAGTTAAASSSPAMTSTNVTLNG